MLTNISCVNTLVTYAEDFCALWRAQSMPCWQYHTVSRYRKLAYLENDWMMFLLMSFIFTSDLFSFFSFSFFRASVCQTLQMKLCEVTAAVELAHGKHSGLLIHYLSAWKIVHHSLDSFVMLNIAFCGTVLGATFPLSVPWYRVPVTSDQ